MVPRGDAGHAGADCLHDAGAFMAQHHGQGHRHGAVEHRQVGMANAGRGHLDQHFAGAGRFQREVFDAQATKIQGYGCFHGRSLSVRRWPAGGRRQRQCLSGIRRKHLRGKLLQRRDFLLELGSAMGDEAHQR